MWVTIRNTRVWGYLFTCKTFLFHLCSHKASLSSPDTYSLRISSPHKPPTLQTLDEFPPQKHLQRPQQSRTVFRLVGWSEFMSKSSCLNLGCLQFVNHPAVYSKREANSFAQAHEIKQGTAHRGHRGLRKTAYHEVKNTNMYAIDSDMKY